MVRMRFGQIKGCKLGTPGFAQAYIRVFKMTRAYAEENFK
jgi:hypothetical protein